MSDWIMLLPSQVFTRIKYGISDKVKTKYKMTDSNFSTESASMSTAVFPFVYVKLLPAVETGRDLEGTSTNGGLFTWQISVIDNQSQSRARDVMAEIYSTMKSMRFEAKQIPSFEDTEDTHTCTARFSRIICSNDIL